MIARLAAGLGLLPLLAALLAFAGVPADPEPAAAPADEPVAEQPAVEWDAEEWLRSAWQGTPYGSETELRVTDLAEKEHGGRSGLVGWVSVDEPNVVHLDLAFVRATTPDSVPRLWALVVHEQTHAAIFQSGTLPPREQFELDPATDRAWAGPLLEMELGGGEWRALEAIGACVEQAWAGEGSEVFYLSGRPCPAEYRDASFDYLHEITGVDWRPAPMR